MVVSLLSVLQLMAVRVRVLQSLVLALVCLSLVVYSSYYATASGPTGPQLPAQAAHRAQTPPPQPPRERDATAFVGREGVDEVPGENKKKVDTSRSSPERVLYSLRSN